MSEDAAGRHPDVVALTRLQSLLLEAEGLTRFLDDLVGLAVETVGPAAACGVTLEAESGRPRTVASSGALADRLDQEQYDCGEGPCLESLDSGEIHPVPDMLESGPWGVFRAAALANEVRSSLSAPLVPPGRERPVGALNMYAREPFALGGKAREQTEAFATYAAGALGVALKMARYVELGEDLRRALDTRAVIDQALGVLMVQQRCDARAAFAVLRRASQNRNEKVHHMARKIVEAVSGGPLDTSPFQPRQ